MTIGRIDFIPASSAQAMCLDPILLGKVQAWAAASNGCFPALGDDGFVRYQQYDEDKVKASIRWAKIKSVDRAIEKVVRVYAQVRFIVPRCILLAIDVC